MPHSALRRAATSAWCMPLDGEGWPPPGLLRPSAAGPSSSVTPSIAASPSAARPRAPLRGRRSGPSRCDPARPWPRRRPPRRPRWASPPPRARVARSRCTSSRSTRSTAPPPARNGSPSVKPPAARPARPAPIGGVELVPAEGEEVGARGRRPVRRQLGGVERRPGYPAPCAASQIRSTGGSHPVTLEAPVRARSAGRGPASRTAVTSSTPKVPSGPHSTQRRRATRAQGSRLAWCSTTVVTTTSSGASRSR